MNTPELLLIDPAFGTPKPYPSEARQFREYHGGAAWLFDPYTGDRRHPLDVGSDPFGLALVKNDVLREAFK